jgi:Zn-dependent protease
MKGSFSLGKVFGIPLRLHYTWFIIFVLVTASLTLYYFPAGYPIWERIMVGAVTSLIFFASVVAHELAHSIVAIHNGIPVTSITLFIFGGVAQITQEPKRPRAELVMTAAGPLCSLLIGGIFGAFWFLMRDSGQLLIADLALWLGMINLMLACFNLIPGFPLDGGRLLRAILWQRWGNYLRATLAASMTGRGIGYLFILGGLVMIFTVSPFNGVWLAFIGWFLENAATTSYRQAKLQDSFRGFTAQEIIDSKSHSVSPYPGPNATMIPDNLDDKEDAI